MLQLRIQGCWNCCISRCVFLGAVSFIRIKISCLRCGKHQRRSDLATDEKEFGYQSFMHHSAILKGKLHIGFCGFRDGLWVTVRNLESHLLLPWFKSDFTLSQQWSFQDYHSLCAGKSHQAATLGLPLPGQLTAAPSHFLLLDVQFLTLAFLNFSLWLWLLTCPYNFFIRSFFLWGKTECLT